MIDPVFCIITAAIFLTDTILIIQQSLQMKFRWMFYILIIPVCGLAFLIYVAFVPMRNGTLFYTIVILNLLYNSWAKWMLRASVIRMEKGSRESAEIDLDGTNQMAL